MCDQELFGEAHEEQEFGLFGAEHVRQSNQPLTPYQIGVRYGRKIYLDGKPMKYGAKGEKRFSSPDDRLKYLDGLMEGYELESDMDHKVKMENQHQEGEKRYEYCPNCCGTTHQTVVRGVDEDAYLGLHFTCSQCACYIESAE